MLVKVFDLLQNLLPFFRPFGGGPRMCLGERFAMTGMKIYMSKFISKFKIEKVSDTKLTYLNGDTFMNCYENMIVKLNPRK